jgi:RNA polymerase sigma-70 factor (ECF subfamily)
LFRLIHESLKKERMNVDEFKRRFMPLHPKLYRIAVVLTGSSVDAEDILQEMYARLWVRRSEWDVVENTEAFCVTMLKNRCLDYLRTTNGIRMNVSLEGLEHTENPLSDSQEHADELQLVRELVERLPDNQRRVLKLHSMGECSTEEIESITGYSRTNIRQLLSRARRTIREQYQNIQRHGQQRRG